MTEAQRTRYYIPAWSHASAACGWRMMGGRLLADLDHQVAAAAEYPHGHPLRDLLPRLIAHARAAAVQDHRAVNADDLRHACNAAASGWRHTSAMKLGNRDITRVVALFKLLADAQDVQALVDWEHPSDPPAAALARALRTADEQAAVAIARNAFHTDDLESLDAGKLRWLLGKVSTK